MIRQLPIKKLKGAVAFVWRCKDGRLILGHLLYLVQLLLDEAALRCLRWSRQAKHRRSVCGVTARQRHRLAIGKHKLIEVNHGDMKGSEVAAQSRVDSARPVCAKFNDSPVKLGARWNGYSIVFIDGIQQPSLDRYAGFHRAMPINLNREGRPRRNRLLAALRLQGQRSKEAQEGSQPRESLPSDCRAFGQQTSATRND